MARIGLVCHTKRAPASNDVSERSTAGKSRGSGRVVAMSRAHAVAQTVVNKYAPAGVTQAMSVPPRAGPAASAICKPLLFQATALAISGIGTTCAISAHRAGR